METKKIDAHSGRAESAQAARYALLRRMALAMHPRMVAQTQDLTAVDESTSEAPSEPASPRVHHVSTRAQHAYSQAAVQACIDVVSWLAPEPGGQVELATGLEECAAMLRHLGFEGLRLSNDGVATAKSVSRSTLRRLVPAALFALQATASSQETVISTAATSGVVRLTLTLVPHPTLPEDLSPKAPGHALAWQDLRALAHAEGVAVECDAQTVTLTLSAK